MQERGSIVTGMSRALALPRAQLRIAAQRRAHVKTSRSSACVRWGCGLALRGWAHTTRGVAGVAREACMRLPPLLRQSMVSRTLPKAHLQCTSVSGAQKGS